jgi:hypothetical protein
MFVVGEYIEPNTWLPFGHKNIGHLMEQQQLQSSIFPGISVTVLLAMIIISTFVSSHGLTK